MMITLVLLVVAQQIPGVKQFLLQSLLPLLATPSTWRRAPITRIPLPSRRVLRSMVLKPMWSLLMGGVVEPRRAFIEQYALEAVNLDI